MIIDNLKEFIAKFSEAYKKNNGSIEEDFEHGEKLEGVPECEEEIGTEEDNDDYPNIPYEHLGGIPALNPDVDITDVYSPCIPDDEIDEPTPCVYGPPSWYDDNRNKERDRQREELRKLRQMEIQDSLVDKPTKCVYGPIP